MYVYIHTHTCTCSLFFSLQSQFPPKEQLQAMQVREPEFRLHMPITPPLEGRDSQFPRVRCPVSQPRRFKLQASSSLRNPVSIKQRAEKEDAWSPNVLLRPPHGHAHLPTHTTHTIHTNTQSWYQRLTYTNEVIVFSFGKLGLMIIARETTTACCGGQRT